MVIESGANGQSFLVYCFSTSEEKTFTPDTEIQYIRFRAWWVNTDGYVKSEIDALTVAAKYAILSRAPPTTRYVKEDCPVLEEKVDVHL
jgi:hypothetical protein